MLVALTGVAVAAAYVAVAHTDPATLDALSRPLHMPDLPWQLVLVSLLAALPAVIHAVRIDPVRMLRSD